MGTMTEKADLTVEIDLSEVGKEARADLFNRLAKLFTEPGQKVSFKFHYPDVDELLLAKARISHNLRHRDRRIRVKYKTSIEDLDIRDPENDTPIRPLEEALEKLRPSGSVTSVELTSRGRGVRLNADGSSERIGE